MTTTDRLKINPALGRMPALNYLLPGELQVDPTYQRSLEGKSSQQLIKDIAQHWNWDLCLPLVVARRGGVLYVIDGQHRLEAAKRRGDIPQLPCVLIESVSAADEAATFVHLNQRRRALSKVDEFKAAIASRDTRANAINDAMQAAGLSIAPHVNYASWKPGMVVNIGGIERAWRIFGDKVAARAMVALAVGFETQVLKYAGTIFPGLSAVCSDEMAGGKAFRGERFEKFTMMLFLKSQDEWRREILRVHADGLTPNEAAEAVLRKAWARSSAETAPPPKVFAPAPGPKPAAWSPPARATPPGLSEKFLPDAEGMSWCDQCDRRVGRDNAVRCKDQRCPLRAAIAA